MTKFLFHHTLQLALMISGLFALEEQMSPSLPNFTVFSNFLYWHPTEAVQWAVAAKGDIEKEIVNYEVLSFDWHPGYQVGLGVFPSDKSSLQFYYTHYYSSAYQTVINGESEYLTPAFLGNYIAENSPNFRVGKAVMNLALNMFDLEADYQITNENILSLSPIIGLKGGWIYQTLNTDWKNFIPATDIVSIAAKENLTNDFWGIGPKLGINGDIKIVSNSNQELSFSSFLTMAFMYGHWEITDEYENSDKQYSTIIVPSRNFAEIMLDCFLGLNYTYTFKTGNYRLGTKVGYQIQDWFDFYQILDVQSGTNQTDLFLQGLSFGINFDF